MDDELRQKRKRIKQEEAELKRRNKLGDKYISKTSEEKKTSRDVCELLDREKAKHEKEKCVTPFKPRETVRQRVRNKRHSYKTTKPFRSGS